MNYHVNEIFTSLQGEGRWTGTPVTFVRLAGCDVHCKWCDTKYAWDIRSGETLTEEDILSRVPEDLRIVVITGGEPLLQDLDALIRALHDHAHMVHIETSGGAPFIGTERPDWLTWSPKPNLLYQADPSVMQACNEIKYVIDDVIGIDVIENMIDELCSQWRLDISICLMPEGTPPTEAHSQTAIRWVTQLAKKTSLHVYYGRRLQCQLKIK